MQHTAKGNGKFLHLPFLFSTFALAQLIYHYCLIFCRKVYFPKEIDNCPAYGGFRPGNLADKYGRNVV